MGKIFLQISLLALSFGAVVWVLTSLAKKSAKNAINELKNEIEDSIANLNELKNFSNEMDQKLNKNKETNQ